MASFGSAFQSALKAGLKAGVQAARAGQQAGAVGKAVGRKAASRAPGRPVPRPPVPGPPVGGLPQGTRRPAREATGPLRFDYAPVHDGKADPGEVVWAWVPFEENDGRGKDRPVLVVSRHGGELLALMLTSKDHTRDAGDSRHWLDVGTGAWDAQRRPSEVRLDRILRLGDDDVRREGCALDKRRFDEVAAAVTRLRAVNGG